MKITDRSNKGAEWIKPRECSVDTVMYIYETIQHKFKIDKQYGEDFVKNHQYLIGQLTIAAVEAMKYEQKDT